MTGKFNLLVSLRAAVVGLKSEACEVRRTCPKLAYANEDSRNEAIQFHNRRSIRYWIISMAVPEILSANLCTCVAA